MNDCTYRAIGVGGAVNGFRADVVITDDPIRGDRCGLELLEPEHRTNPYVGDRAVLKLTGWLRGWSRKQMHQDLRRDF